MRPMAERFAPSLIGTAFLAIVSFGIIPLFMLPRKLRSFAARERDQLWHFAQWMRGQFGAEANSLDPRTPALDQVVHVLRLVSWGCGLIALGSIFCYVINGAQSDDLMRVGYGYFRHQRFLFSAWDESFFPLWMTSLCVGYAAHWAAVQVHQTRVRRFVECFNKLARQQSLLSSDMDSGRSDFRVERRALGHSVDAGGRGADTLYQRPQPLDAAGSGPARARRAA
jgi:hypothetical protein